MGKRLLVLFLIAFCLGLVSGTPSINTQYNLTVSCENFNCANLNVTILYPNSTIFINNQQMDNNVYYAKYSFTPSVKGEYVYYLFDGGNYSDGKIEVTYTGKTINSAQAILYSAFFFILVFVFIMVIFGIQQLPSDNERDEEGKILSITYLKYLRNVLWFFEWMLFIGILYISSSLAFAYLHEELFAQILFTFFRISFGITPIIVIVWMIWIFVRMFHDKQMQQVLNRGMFPQGRL